MYSRARQSNVLFEEKVTLNRELQRTDLRIKRKVIVIGVAMAMNHIAANQYHRFWKENRNIIRLENFQTFLFNSTQK